MTLKEFVAGFMDANDLTKEMSVDDTCAYITQKAKEKATGGSACLSEDDVEKLILAFAALPPAKREEAKKMKAEVKAVKPDEPKPEKPKADPKPKPEKKDEEQLSLFDF